MALHGIVTALLTPFRADERIDCSAWQTLVDTQIAAGVHGLFVGGSTGEFYAQDLEERTVGIRFVRQAARQLPVFANVGCISTRDTVKLALAAQAEGVDVLAVVTPWYIKPSQAELVEHFVEVCRAVQLPVLAYNYPQHGGVEILPETVSRIARECPNLVGVKDSSGIPERLPAFVKAAPDRELAVFIGPEKLAVYGLGQGCAGVVSGCANIAPKLLVDLYRAIREGRTKDAERLQAQVDRLTTCVPLHTFPGAIKEAVGIAGPCRKPVGPMPPDARARLQEILAEVGESPRRVTA